MKSWTFQSLMAGVALTALAACGGDTYDDRASSENPEPDRREVASNDGYGVDSTAQTPDADLGEPADLRGVEDTGEIDSLIVSVSEVLVASDVETFVDNAFQRADNNGDDALNRNEYDIVAASFSQAGHSVGESETDPAAVAPGEVDGDDQMAEGWRSVEPDGFFQTVAGDDEMLSQAELMDAFKTRFKVADADGDGSLDSDEASDFVRLALAVEEDGETRS